MAKNFPEIASELNKKRQAMDLQHAIKYTTTGAASGKLRRTEQMADGIKIVVDEDAGRSTLQITKGNVVVEISGPADFAEKFYARCQAYELGVAVIIHDGDRVPTILDVASSPQKFLDRLIGNMADSLGVSRSELTADPDAHPRPADSPLP